MKYIKISIKYILITLIALWTYNHTTVTLYNTDSIILTEIVKLSAVTMITYLIMCALIPIGRLLLKLIDRRELNDKNYMR